MTFERSGQSYGAMSASEVFTFLILCNGLWELSEEVVAKSEKEIGVQ